MVFTQAKYSSHDDADVKRLKPQEFRNRLDGTVVFTKLTSVFLAA